MTNTLNNYNCNTLAGRLNTVNNGLFGVNNALIIHKRNKRENICFNKTSYTSVRILCNNSKINTRCCVLLANAWGLVRKTTISNTRTTISTLEIIHLRSLVTISNNKEIKLSVDFIYYMQYFKLNQMGIEKFHSSSMSGKSSKIWVSYSLFVNDDLVGFKKALFYSGRLNVGVYYSVLFKIRKGDIYLMMGNKQEGVMFNSFDDEYFEELFELIQDKLGDLFNEYPKELDYSCDTILLDF